MASKRASIFDEPDELDVSGFTPRTTPAAAPPQQAVREISEAAKFSSREPVKRAPSTAPPPQPKREQRRYRTGRNVQFNVKASQETVDAFYAISDQQGWVLSETLEQALGALQRALIEGKDSAP